MTKKKPNEIKKPDNPKSLSTFLKKRAPIYLGLIGLFMIFAYPALTEKNLESLLPDNFDEEQKKAIELIKSYKGINEKGMTVLEVIEQTILDKYPDEKIFDDEDTSADILVNKLDENDSGVTHTVIFLFHAQDQSIEYGWNVNIDTLDIFPLDTDSRKIQQTVDYFD